MTAEIAEIVRNLPVAATGTARDITQHFGTTVAHLELSYYRPLLLGHIDTGDAYSARYTIQAAGVAFDALSDASESESSAVRFVLRPQALAEATSAQVFEAAATLAGLSATAGHSWQGLRAGGTSPRFLDVARGELLTELTLRFPQTMAEVARGSLTTGRLPTEPTLLAEHADSFGGEQEVPLAQRLEARRELLAEAVKHYARDGVPTTYPKQRLEDLKSAVVGSPPVTAAAVLSLTMPLVAKGETSFTRELETAAATFGIADPVQRLAAVQGDAAAAPAVLAKMFREWVEWLPARVEERRAELAARVEVSPSRAAGDAAASQPQPSGSFATNGEDPGKALDGTGGPARGAAAGPDRGPAARPAHGAA